MTLGACVMVEMNINTQLCCNNASVSKLLSSYWSKDLKKEKKKSLLSAVYNRYSVGFFVFYNQLIICYSNEALA